MSKSRRHGAKPDSAAIGLQPDFAHGCQADRQTLEFRPRGGRSRRPVSLINSCVVRRPARALLAMRRRIGNERTGVPRTGECHRSCPNPLRRALPAVSFRWRSSPWRALLLALAAGLATVWHTGHRRPTGASCRSGRRQQPSTTRSRGRSAAVVDGDAVRADARRDRRAAAGAGRASLVGIESQQIDRGGRAGAGGAGVLCVPARSRRSKATGRHIMS